MEEMERAGDVLARPRSARKKTRSYSTEYLAAIKAILTKFCVTYREALVEELLIVWRDALSDLSIRALDAGFRETMKRHSDFMPTPAKFRGYAEEALSRMDQPGNSHENCTFCQGTGWRVVKRQDGQGDCAVRCDGEE
jgi:hypothetical protein